MGVPIEDLEDDTRVKINGSMLGISIILEGNRQEMVMLLECLYDTRVPAHCILSSSAGDWLAAGTVLRHLSGILTCSLPEFIQPLETLRMCTSRLDLTRLLHAHYIQELSGNIESIQPQRADGSDARSVQVVYEHTRRQWVTSDCLPTNRSSLQDAAVTIREGSRDLVTVSELLSCIQVYRSTEKEKLDMNGLSNAYERLAFLLQLSAGRLQKSRDTLLALTHQITLSSILQARYDECPATATLHANARNIQAALDGGDMTMLALLDIADVNLNCKERIAVANVFARRECKCDIAHFKTSIEHEPGLGDRASVELCRVGLI